MGENTEKKVKKEPYLDPQGNRRDPNRQGHPILCNGISRRSQELCRNIARPNGKCRNHGGNATGPKTAAGKKAISDAVKLRNFKTGEHAPIWFDMLDVEEQDIIELIPKDAEVLLEQDIMLTTIRERRMMKHIMALQELIDNGRRDVYTQESWKRHIKRTADGEELSFVREDGSVEKESEMINTSMLVIKDDPRKQLRDTEDALTRVQAHKAKLIELKHKLAEGNIDRDDGSLKQLTDIISKARVQRVKHTTEVEMANQEIVEET